MLRSNIARSFRNWVRPLGAAAVALSIVVLGAQMTNVAQAESYIPFAQLQNHSFGAYSVDIDLSAGTSGGVFGTLTMDNVAFAETISYTFNGSTVSITYYDGTSTTNGVIPTDWIFDSITINPDGSVSGGLEGKDGVCNSLGGWKKWACKAAAVLAGICADALADLVCEEGDSEPEYDTTTG